MIQPHRPRWIYGGLLIAVACSLSACGLSDALGLGKRAPDEFAVVKREPLIVPPEHDLRPPRPGAPRPQVGTPGDQARAALTGRPVEQVLEQRRAAESQVDANVSEGERALLARTNTAENDPQVREEIAAERPAWTRVDSSMFSRLLTWQPDPSGERVDAAGEAQRLLRAPQRDRAVLVEDAPEVIRRSQRPLQDLEEDLF